MAGKRILRSERFLKSVADARDVLVVTHNNPDPDAIASGWALLVLVRTRLEKPGRLVAGGAIVRAENLRMVELLKPPIELVDRVEPDADTAVVLVDCHPLAENHLLDGESMRPVAVIDHHDRPRGRIRNAYTDIRPRAAASATLVTQYLREQKVEPGQDVATALIYALNTDAQAAGTTFTRGDRSAILWLTERFDPAKLTDIENAPLHRDYYADLLLAMQSTFIYEDAALCFLPRASGPEIIGEVGDLLIRCEHTRRVLCGAAINEDLFFSVRTSAAGGDANTLMQRVLKGLGRGGGHLHRAGGKIPAASQNGHMTDDLQTELRNRWLAACGVDQQRGTRLVPRREILENL